MRVISLTSKTVLSLLLLIFAASLLAQTEADLQTEYAQKLAYKKQVYERILQFISENPDSPNLADLYFNVAELSTEVEVFQPEKTVSYYQKVLEYDPNFLQKDVVLHNIGYFGYKAETSKRDAGRIAQIELVMNWPDSLRLSEYKLQYVISAYRQILEELPQSPYNTDAAYRLGRIYFDLAIDARVAEKYFNQAIGYFDIVAKRDGDPLQYYGLFQRGWTYFASTRFTAAIADFSTILNILGNSAQADKRTFFEADAIENIAFSLIEYDGTDFVGYSQAAAQAKEILRSCVEDDYGRQILIQAVKLKKEYNAPMQAVDLYESYLMLYPASKNSPCIVDSVIAIYRQYPKRIRGERSAEEMIIAGMEKLVTDFNVGSAWYENNQDLDISNELQIIGNAYAFLEPKYLNNFLRTRSSEDFRKYEAMVVNYCAFGEFSDEESRERKQRLRNNLVDLSQDLAEITEDPAHYLATIAEIDNYIAGQSSSAELYHYYELKFYNYEKLYDLLDPVIDQHPFTDGERTIDRARLDSLFIATATEYENFLLKYKLTDDKVGDQLIRVLYRKAELYNESGDADSARDNYLQLLSYELGDELKMITYSRLAEISQAQKDFDKAEYYYREASKFAVDGSKSDFENNLLATVLARAKAYEDASNFREAARQYLKIAAELETSKPDESVNFLLKAIDNYLKGGEPETAIQLYLDIASRKTEKSEVLSAYHGAWSIADSLQYWNESVRLRRQFIKLYPTSNEAFKLNLHIIGFYEGSQFNDKRQAARLLEQLHSEAGNLDLGEEKPENILLQAIKIYQELDDTEKVMELSILFDQLYPQHESANNLLVAVAKTYKERGDEANYERIASRLYSKDRNLDLLVEVAVNKLKDIKDDADRLFENQQYDSVLDEIARFDKEEADYKKQGMQLPTEHIHETFAYYTNYIDYFNRFAAVLFRAHELVLDSSPQDLIKVNELTKWKDHLSEGESRISKLMKKCDNIRDEFIAIIQEGNQYNLGTLQRTEALYTAAQLYDYSADVVTKQVQKYLDISKQLNDKAMKANPIQQEQYKTALKNTSLQMATDFRKKAVQLYQTLLMTFADDKDYSDKWTEKSLARLLEWGVRKEAVEVVETLAIPDMKAETICTDQTWLAAGSSLRYDPNKTSLSLAEFCETLIWLPVGKANFQYFKNQMFGLEQSEAQEIWFTDLDTTNVDIVYFRKVLQLPENASEAQLKIFAQHMFTIWVNGQQLADAVGVVYDPTMKKVQAQQIDIGTLNKGENTIVIEVIGADYYKGLIAELTYKPAGKE